MKIFIVFEQSGCYEEIYRRLLKGFLVPEKAEAYKKALETQEKKQQKKIESYAIAYDEYGTLSEFETDREKYSYYADCVSQASVGGDSDGYYCSCWIGEDLYNYTYYIKELEIEE